MRAIRGDAPLRPVEGETRGGFCLLLGLHAPDRCWTSSGSAVLLAATITGRPMTGSQHLQLTSSQHAWQPHGRRGQCPRMRGWETRTLLSQDGAARLVNLVFDDPIRHDAAEPTLATLISTSRSRPWTTVSEAVPACQIAPRSTMTSCRFSRIEEVEHTGSIAEGYRLRDQQHPW